MTVTSLELCKELYELSGWFDTLDYSYQNMAGEYKTQRAYTHDVRGGWWVISGTPADDTFPIYTSDYLLRKLPSDCFVGKLYAQKADKNFYDAYLIQLKNSSYESRLEAGGDTPADALCGLAIELFKQGILT